MKYIQVYALFLMVTFHTALGQKQTEPHKDNINYNIKDTVTSYGPNTMVRNVKQGRNGNILIAASWGIVRYDKKSFTNLTSKIGRADSGMFWKIEAETFGSLPLIPEFIITMAKPFNISQPGRDLPIICNIILCTKDFLHHFFNISL